VDHLTWFTAESFGGPDRVSRRLGFQYLIDKHRHLNITDKQRPLRQRLPGIPG
jgi:hemoglobin